MSVHPLVLSDPAQTAEPLFDRETGVQTVGDDLSDVLGRLIATRRPVALRVKPKPRWEQRRKRVPPTLRVARSILTPEERARASVLHSYRQAARARSLVFSIPDAKFFALISGPCFYCGLPPSNAKRVPQRPSFRYSGLDRLNPARGYEPGNVVPCCRTCNFAKRQQSVQEFVDWVQRCYRHLTTKG